MSILTQPERTRRQSPSLLARLMPNSCFLCGADAGASILCPGCAHDLPRAPVKACPRCGAATAHGEHCGPCLLDPPAFSSTSAAFCYEFPVDRMIHALKYQHTLALARHFAEAIADSLPDRHFDCLIPLPLHPMRLRERGFNQAMEIVRHLQKIVNLPVDRNSLQRRHQTAPQASLPLAERRRNVQGAFTCDRPLAGQRIMLVDDVLTTGATAGECARILAQAGASRIHVAVVARALKH